MTLSLSPLCAFVCRGGNGGGPGGSCDDVCGGTSHGGAWHDRGPTQVRRYPYVMCPFNPNDWTRLAQHAW